MGNPGFSPPGAAVRLRLSNHRHGVAPLSTRLVIISEIIAPYRIPVFNALAQRSEIELRVIFLSENDPTFRRWRVYKDEIDFSYEVLPSWRYRLGKHSFLLNCGMLRALDRINPEAVLCGGYNYISSWQAAYWAGANRVPFLLWSESTAFDRRRKYRTTEFMKQYFLRLCSAFVVPGKSSANYLRTFGIPEASIFTAPNAVDNLLFSRFAEGARANELAVRSRQHLPERYFLYVGRLIKEKGVFDLLQAYAQLPAQTRRGIGLVFAGSGARAVELAHRASQITAGTVRFLDFVHRDDLAEIYALAEALLFPTHSDPWGLVVNEAMACGLPVIATDVAGCALDLVMHGYNGFLVEPGDVSGLCLAMTQLAGNAELRMQMGSASLERSQEYSPEKWADGICEAIQFVRPA
jgi:glycosyltransferase involved in cell wall biosynthesis